MAVFLLSSAILHVPPQYRWHTAHFNLTLTMMFHSDMPDNQVWQKDQGVVCVSTTKCRFFRRHGGWKCCNRGSDDAAPAHDA